MSVIEAASRVRPADAALREGLKRHRGLAPGQAREITESVFAFYRWRGWVEEHPHLTEQLRLASELARRFASKPGSFSDAELAARAVPAWTSAELAVSPAWLRALQRPPRLWLRARPGQGRVLAQRLGDCRSFGTGPLADILEYYGNQDLFRTERFHVGSFEIQDLSSQAVGLLCSPQPGQTWWDACAGEGGKMLHLSDLMHNQGLIWASDPVDWRLRRLRRRAARARVFNYRVAPWNGGLKLPTRTRFDGVLVDAPCSGVGTWHRNPHARWTTTTEDVHQMSQLQRRLLCHAAPAVKPGGRLVYAVCTLTHAETITVVRDFVQQCPGFEPLPARNPLVPGGPPAPQITLRTEDSGGNGMFIAVWRRR